MFPSVSLVFESISGINKEPRGPDLVTLGKVAKMSKSIGIHPQSLIRHFKPIRNQRNVTNTITNSMKIKGSHNFLPIEHLVEKKRYYRVQQYEAEKI